MRVRVLFFGILKDIVGRSEESLEIEVDSTLANLFEAYSTRFETLRAQRSSILFARNREFATPETALAENDEVAFLPPVSGGCGVPIFTPEEHVFALTRDPIDAQKLSRRLQRPEDGAPDHQPRPPQQQIRPVAFDAAPRQRVGQQTHQEDGQAVPHPQHAPVLQHRRVMRLAQHPRHVVAEAA